VFFLIGFKLALQVIKVNHLNFNPLIKENITFPLSIILFVKETHFTLLKIEKSFSSYSIVKHYLILAL
jgi:hypothetical protein